MVEYTYSGSTTQQTLTPEQQSLLSLGLPQIQQFAASPPQLPGFSGVAGFDPTQVAAQNQALAAAGGYSQALTGAQQAYQQAVPRLGDIAGQAANTYGTLTSGQLLSPESNPWLQAHMNQAVQSAAAPITQQLTEGTLPNIRGQAVNTGYGSSRQGIAEGLASGRASQEIGRQGQGIVTDLANRAYGQGLDAMTRGLGMTSEIQGAQTAGADAMGRAAQLAGEQITPAGWTSAVGDVRQGLTQQQLDEQTQRFNYEQMLPLLTGKELIGIMQGLPGGGTTTTGYQTQPKKNMLSSILGGAMTGAAAGSKAGPWGALIGGGLGAGAGALS